MPSTTQDLKKFPLDLDAIPAIHQALQAEGTSDISTSSTTFVDMADMSVTITTGNNPVLIIFSVSVDNSISGTYLVIDIDGVDERGASVADSGMYWVGTQAVLKTLSAGSHTIKGQWKVDSGTSYCYATTEPDKEHRRLIVIELKK